MNDQEKKMLRSMAFASVSIFATIGLFYLINIDIIKSAGLMGLIYSVFTLVLFMVLVTCVGMLYQFARIKKVNIPGIYSNVFYKHLTTQQVDNLSKSHEGRIDVFYHEFLLMRLDIILPAALIFGFIFMGNIPSIAASTINYIVMGELLGLFTLSYLIYTQMQAKMIAIKLNGSIPEEQSLNLQDVIQMTAMEI